MGGRQYTLLRQVFSMSKFSFSVSAGSRLLTDASRTNPVAENVTYNSIAQDRITTFWSLLVPKLPYTSHGSNMTPSQLVKGYTRLAHVVMTR